MFDLLRRTTKAPSTDSVRGRAPYRDLTPAQVKERLGGPHPVELVDVRSPGEYARGHIHSARLIPLGELRHRIAELPTDAEVILYCHSSARSRRAAELLAGMGRTGVYNMSGGIVSWPYGLESGRG